MRSGWPRQYRKCRWYYGRRRQTAELTVTSGTVLYDRQERSRVFQNQEQSYGDIIRRMAGETEHGACILTAADRKTRKSFFQYEETDWEFAKRVASHLGLTLGVDSGFHYPRVYIGLRSGEMREISAESSRTLVLRESGRELTDGSCPLTGRK